MYKVLLVDDDIDIQETNEVYLKRAGYQVWRAETSEAALKIAGTTALDAIVLDVKMPDIDGVEVCRRLREDSFIPILFLSAYAEDDDRIQGLLAGGDDFIAKPYSLLELELRLRRRIEASRGQIRPEILRFDQLEIDMGTRSVRIDGQGVGFTPLEFDLLAFLAAHPGQVFSYEQLYDRIWRTPINQSLHNLQMCVARIRQKLDALCPEQNYIETVRRKGYRFNRRRSSNDN